MATLEERLAKMRADLKTMQSRAAGAQTGAPATTTRTTGTGANFPAAGGSGAKTGSGASSLDQRLARMRADLQTMKTASRLLGQTGGQAEPDDVPGLTLPSPDEPAAGPQGFGAQTTTGSFRGGRTGTAGASRQMATGAETPEQMSYNDVSRQLNQARAEAEQMRLALYGRQRAGFNVKAEQDAYNAAQARVKELEQQQEQLAGALYQNRTTGNWQDLQGSETDRSTYQQAKDLRAEQNDLASLIGAVEMGDPTAYMEGNGDLAEIARRVQQQYGVNPGESGYLKKLYDLQDDLARQERQQAESLAEAGVSYEDALEFDRRQQLAADAQKRRQDWAEFASQGPLQAAAASAGTVVVNPFTGLEYIGQLAGNAGHNDPGNISTYRPLDANQMDMTDFVNTVRSTVAGNIRGQDDSMVRNAAAFLYETGMSVVDSSAQLVTMGPVVSLAAMGGSAAAQRTKEVLENGGTNRQALMAGAASGIFEVLFEKVSIDNLLSTKTVDGWKSWIKETAKQAGVEASEEVFTEIANIMADAVIMGDNSDFNRAVREYMAQGMSEAEAKKQATLDTIAQVGLAGLGGALSGGMMGGVVNAFNGVANSRLGQQVQEQEGQQGAQEGQEGPPAPGAVPAQGEDNTAPAPSQAGSQGQNQTTQQGETTGQTATQDRTAALLADADRGVMPDTETIMQLTTSPEGMAVLQQVADRVRQHETGSTAVNTNPADHTQAEQQVIREYQSAADENLLAFINSWKTATDPRYKNAMKATVADVTDRTARDVQTLTGVDVSGYQHTINGSALQHIENRHGQNGENDHSMADQNDIARLGYVLNNYDDARIVTDQKGKPRTSTAYRNADGSQAPMVMFTKKVNGTYYAVEAVPDARAREMHVVSAYMQNNSGSINQVLDMEQGSPQLTSETPVGSVASAEPSVPQPAGNVNTGRTAPGVRDLRGQSGGVRLAALLGDEDVAFLDRLGKAAGVAINIVDADARARGWYQDGQVYIAENAANEGRNSQVRQVAIHEITHYMKDAAPEEYRRYTVKVAELLGEDMDRAVQRVKNDYAEAGVELTDEDALDEVAAHFTENLMEDESLYRRLAVEDRTLAQRVLDALRRFIERIKDAITGRQAGQLDQIAEAWADALDQAGENARQGSVETGEGRRYSFAGRNANRADLERLSRAEQMERDGRTTEEIYRDTGWFRGMDGKWRWEIDDSGMEYRGDAGETLGDIISHDELFRNYPQLRNVRVQFDDLGSGTTGQYTAETGTITLDNSLRSAPEDTLIHEVQHAIQHAEGFTGGSNTGYWSREGTRRLDEADNEESRLRDEYKWRMNNDPHLTDLIRQYDAGQLTREEYYDARDSYLEGDPEYADLERRIAAAARDSMMYATSSDYDLYRNTAGEIEARDAAARRAMDAETRGLFLPDLGDENTVFADEAEQGYSMSDNGETARWTTERIDRLYDNYASTSQNYSKAYAAFISPEDFLSLTTTNLENIERGSRELDQGELADYRQEIYLAYDPDSPGEVSGHEGRHRMVALRNAGVKSVPVVIQFWGEQGKQNRQPIDALRLRGQEFSAGRAPGRVTLRDLVPISRAHRAEIEQKFGATDGAKVRFSLENTEGLGKELYELRRQNQRLEEKNKRLQAQFRRTDGNHVDPDAVKSAARKLLRDFSSKADLGKTADALRTLYDRMGETGARPGDAAVREAATEVARSIIDSATVTNDEMWQTYRPLRKFLRETKIKVTPDVMGGLDVVGGLGEYRKAFRNRLNLSTVEGRSIDDVYGELSYDYPELFNQDVHSNEEEQLVHLGEVLDALRPTTANPYTGDEGVVDYLAGEILERYYDMPGEAPTFADRAAYRQQEAVERERQAGLERMQRALARQEERTKDRIERIKEQNRQANARMRERMTTTQVKDTVKRHAEGLSRKLLRPTDKQFIPERLRGTVVALLDSIDLESKYAYETTPEGQFRRVALVDENGKPIQREDLKPTKRTEAARALKEALEELKKDQEFDLTVDPDLEDKLREIAGYGDVRLADMNGAQAQTVWEAVQAVERSITLSNRLLGDTKYARVSDMANAMWDAVGDRKNRRNFAVKPLAAADKLLNLDMMTPETFFHRLGKPGDEIHRQMRAAQDRQITITNEGVEQFQDALKESGLTARDLQRAERENHTFTTAGGQEITLTTAQLMDLYALSHRKQAMDHIYTGGLRAQGGKAGLYETGKAAPIHVTLMDVANMLHELTPAQKGFVDRLQKYMSTTLAAHGNEASMEVYGYEKFREQYYWPIDVNPNEVKTEAGQKRGEQKNKSVRSYGMTKATTPDANNSVMLHSAVDTYAKHLNQMATYASWLATEENITKLHNFTFFEDGQRTGTIGELFDRVYGKGGNAYLDDLMSDVAQGTKTGAESTFSDSLLNHFKAAKVGANLRVIFQQPTAILRAAEIINPKYMATLKNPLKGFERAKKWSPIALWKDWGYFEMDTGRSLRELMVGSESAVNKVKNATMAGAGIADNVAWGHLWNAVEAETRANHKDLKAGSDAFYRQCAQRFGEIIDRTQVVDSVLHRTQIMRSSNFANRLATSFMSEPSKIYNMAARDFYDIIHAEKGSQERKQAVKHVVRTGAALIASFAVNAIAQSAPDWWRDDDRDKEFVRTFQNKWAENFTENFDPVGYIPYLKDIESIIQGYDVERSDMEGIADLWSAAETMMKAVNGTGKKSVLNAGLELAMKGLDLMGLPAGNIKRDVVGILNSALWATGEWEAVYEMDKLMLDVNNSSNASVFYDTLYRAMDGDWMEYQHIYGDMLEHGFDPDKINSAMNKRMAEAAGLAKAKNLPLEWTPPGEDADFDAMVQAEGSWLDRADEDALELARTLDGAELEGDTDSEKNRSAMRLIADQPYSEDVKEMSMEGVMSASAYAKYMAARAAGVSTYDYVDFLEAAREANLARGKSGSSFSQDDVTKALEGSRLTVAQKRAIWAAQGWKAESPWG